MPLCIKIAFSLAKKDIGRHCIKADLVVNLMYMRCGVK